MIGDPGSAKHRDLARAASESPLGSRTTDPGPRLQGFSRHDFPHPHQQAVRPAGPLRRRVLSAQRRGEGRPRRPQRRRQDDAVPDDHGRRSAGRWRRVGPEEADDRLLPPGCRGDVRPIRARRGDRRQRTRRALLHHELEALQHAMGDPGTGGRHGSHPRPLRRSAGRVRASGRLRAREPGARGAARARLRGRADRRRRRRAVGRMEDARCDGPRAARASGRPADGRADEPSRHRVDHLARGVPEVAAGCPAHDLARSRLHESHRLAHRGDRWRRDHELLGQLRLLRARAGDPRGQPRGGLRASAGDAGQGAALHRPVRGACRQGGAGAEPGQGAREDRKDRAAQEAARRRIRLPAAAALGRSGGGPRGRRRRRTAAASSTTVST